MWANVSHDPGPRGRPISNMSGSQYQMAKNETPTGYARPLLTQVSMSAGRPEWLRETSEANNRLQRENIYSIKRNCSSALSHVIETYVAMLRMKDVEQRVFPRLDGCCWSRD